MAEFQSAAPVDTPREVNVKYHHDEGDLLPDPLKYCQFVGSLNYLTITRPCHSHLAMFRRVIYYLKGTFHRVYFFGQLVSQFACL